MSLFSRFRAGLKKTQEKLGHEIKRIFTGSPKLTTDSLEELEYVLISADLGMALTQQIVQAVQKAYESQGRKGSLDIGGIARLEIESCFTTRQSPLILPVEKPGIISVVGVNGVGKTTSCAKLAYRIQKEQGSAMMAACDTFRAAAIEQLKLWGERLNVPVIAGEYGADPAAIAHDAVRSAIAKQVGVLLVDTAGRLHTKKNLMQELQKVHRVMDKQMPGAPHETLLVVDATTGMNAMNQAREFNKMAPLTGVIVTKLDSTSKGGMALAIQKELGIPIKFVGLGEQPEDLQPFDSVDFANALFPDSENE